MKKTLALVLALAMVFSTITVAFAEDALGEDAQICANLGMLKGETGTVDAAYLATAPERYQAAVMFLRLKGLEAEALAFTGEDNFTDGEMAWAEGANMLAYLKANPQLGWVGNPDGSFGPNEPMTAQAYYKVLLEALGYKQSTAEVAGDFTWDEVFTFAASVGLSKVADVANFTVNDLAVATVEALKVNVKGTEEALYKSLVTEEAAVAAGLVEAAPAAPAVAVDEAVAIGNTVVEVTYEDDVDAAAAGNIDNYAIEGLEIKAVVVNDTDSVLLTTAAQEAGKLYKLTVGEKTVLFAGIAKVSDGPQIEEVVSEDVEEVVIDFDRNIDYATGTDVANYTISGITVVAAEVDEDEVTLTTEGLKDDTSYTVKVTNMKSVDGVSRKADSESFRSNYDVAAPRIDQDETLTMTETNQRIVLYFNEEVTEESAEDIANYSIKVNESDGAELEVISVTWDDDDENNVEIVTEPMEDGEDYKLSVSNIADQRKVPNVMTRPSTWTFEGEEEDEDAPELESATAISSTQIIVEFSDDSKFDEGSLLDPNSYSVEGDDTLGVEEVAKLRHENGLFRALLTVEEMETDDNYDLEVVDILDEFGNALDSDTISITGGLDEYASAAVTGIAVNGENMITLTFDKALVEASAENIANYSIDGDIGTPTGATYDDEGDIYTVELELNDMTNGEEYELTIDGLEDLAGNKLKLTYEFLAVAADPDDNWDDDAPVLEDAEAINEFVLALEFDEEIVYDDDPDGGFTSTIELVSDGLLDEDNNPVFVDENGDALYVDENGNDLYLTEFTEAAPLVLTAFADSDDGKVVEFSGADRLLPGVTYTVYRATGLEDLMGIAYVVDQDENDLISFRGTDEEVELVEIDEIEQVNGGQFDVTMTGFVDFVGAVDVDTDGDGEDDGLDIGDFVATIDDDVITLTIEAAGGITKNQVYEINFSNFFQDLHGFRVVDDDDVVDFDNYTFTTNAVTELEGEETDDDAPYIEGIVAVDRTTIEIEFSEDIEEITINLGDFEITNVDLDEPVDIDSIDDVDGNILTLVLDDELEGRYEYELAIDADAVFDFAGNGAEADTFVFDGSDLAQNKVELP